MAKRKPESYVTQITETWDGKIPLPFGLKAPEGALWAWGYRAIKNSCGVSLVWDRQGHIGDVPTKRVDTVVIPILMEHGKDIDSDDPKFYHYDFGEMKAVQSAQRSYGYIYGVVYAR